MNTGESTTIRLKGCLLRLRTDRETARAELMEFARRRLQQLAERMFARYRVLHAHEHADDLFQEAMIRLLKSLDEVGPTTVEAFMGLAALQMRRSLVDLARLHLGRRQKLPANDPSARRNGNQSIDLDLNAHADDRNGAPELLIFWEEFHEAANNLNGPERTAFDLLYYGELTQNEVAELMGTSDRQIRRYWLSARRQVGRKIDGFWPEA